MAKLLIAALILILAVVGVYYFSSSKNNIPQTPSVAQRVIVPNNQPSPTPTVDTSDSSLNSDLTALDKDLANLSSSDASFAGESQGL